MNAQIKKGNIAGVPYGQTVVNIDSADVAVLLGATTALVKVVAGAAMVGAGIAAGFGLIASILSGIESSLTTQKPAKPDPKLPLGSAPTWIETDEGEFWGIILEPDFVLWVNGRQLIIPYSRIYKVECAVEGIFSLRDEINIELVAGQRYKGYVRHKDGETNNVWPLTHSIQVATIGGVQIIPIVKEVTTGAWFWKRTHEEIVPAQFSPSHISDVHTLRKNLKYVLKQNNKHISNLIGQNILHSFFNVSSIP